MSHQSLHVGHIRKVAHSDFRFRPTRDRRRDRQRNGEKRFHNSDSFHVDLYSS